MDSNHIAIRELDLSSYHPTTVVDRVGAVPVLKTSAGKKTLFLFPFPPPQLVHYRSTLKRKKILLPSRPPHPSHLSRGSLVLRAGGGRGNQSFKPQSFKVARVSSCGPVGALFLQGYGCIYKLRTTYGERQLQLPLLYWGRNISVALTLDFIPRYTYHTTILN